MKFGNLTFSAVAAASMMFAANASYATVLDLTTDGSGTINGGLFVTPGTDPDEVTGTGVFDPFLRIRMNGEEEGWNSDRPNAGTDSVEFDELTGVWTHSFQLQDMLVVDGKYEFVLDINENVPQGELSLDAVRLFDAGSDKDATGLSFGDGTNPFGGAFTEIWNMDALADSTVLLDYNNVGTGSGRGDMSLFLDASLFAGVGAEDYIIFYSAFGGTNSADAGFEEWAFRSGVIPLPAGLPLMLTVLGAFGIVRARKRKAA